MVGSCVVAVVALTGVIITVLTARNTFRDEQAEGRRDRQRILIAELITAVREESRLRRWEAEVMGSAAGDALCVMQTPTYELLVKAFERRGSLLVQARMDVGDEALRPHVEKLADRLKEVTGGRAHKLLASKDAATRGSAVTHQQDLLRTIGTIVDELEETAVVHLAVPLTRKR